MLRLLQASKVSTLPSTSEPTLTLHVPAYGVLYLPRPSLGSEPPPGHDSSGRDDDVDNLYQPNECRGELEINIPRQVTASSKTSGSALVKSRGKRCKAIRVTFQSIVRLAMGPDRGWEEDVIFEREIGDLAGSSEGIWLEEGVTRFEFVFLLPPTLAPHGYHHDAEIKHVITAEIEGLPHHHTSHSFFPFRSPSPSGSRSASRNRDRSRAGSPTPGESHNYMPPSSISLIRQIDGKPPAVPSYEESEAEAHGTSVPSTPLTSSDDQDDWIEGTFKISRYVRLCYNPHERGEINMLDERQTGFVDGLGVWDIQYKSWPWTISGILLIKGHFQPSPTTTIFYARVTLIHNLHIESPRDKNGRVNHVVRKYPIAEIGSRPRKQLGNPDATRPALWRGSQVGGKDPSDWEWSGKGRLPHDREIRPTTIESIVTPVVIRHQLMLEVLFSVYGEDANGVKMTKPGPGEVRRMQVHIEVVIPPCPIIPQVISLPTYPSHSAMSFASPNKPCPLCHTPTEDKLCTTCGPTKAPHPRHDHPPKLVGNKDGICPLCSTSILPAGDVGWKNCACALSFEDMEKLSEGKVWWRDSVASSVLQGRNVIKAQEEERGRRIMR